MAAQPNIATSELPGNATVGGDYVQVRINQTEDEGPGASVPAPRRPAGHPGPQDRVPEERAKVRDLWTKATVAAARLWTSAKGDRNEMSGAAFDLNDLLARLWDFKAHRDDNWIGILDQAQTALKALAAADGGIESTEPDRCWKLLQLVEIYLSPATKTIDDLNKAVQLVAEMGLSPYAGLEPLGDA